MDNDMRSPHITHLSWGRVEVDTGDGTESYRDIKLWPGGAREWDWGEVLQTDDAVERFNELADTERVGALLHSTR